ncbi:hypothetical protein [Anaeroselena agilis]|uniref:Uncharacterized protein n=1 Tax=Anaeroselena agilis TaxID=3063788 RepID=A0ABU3P1J8_9FIRM|nr:hypothetical protein [Selenomonadales bacterium 4137-cl]
MDSNRSAIIKELTVILVIVALLLATGGLLVRNVVVGLRSLDNATLAGELDGGIDKTFRGFDIEKTIRELAGKFLPAKEKQPAPVGAKKGQVTTVRFFEGGRQITPYKQRTYSAQFSPRAKNIYTEIAYKNNSYKIADAAIPVVLQYIDPAGRKVVEIKKTTHPKKDWASVVFASGAGADEVGSWQTGRYTVKVYFDGDHIGDYNFTIQ